MHYLITGHTGFKGSWLSLMLEMQGHTVSGISLDPLKSSLFNEINTGNIYKHDLRIDIRNKLELAKSIEIINPQVIIHLAAQSLVRESYKNPIDTFETNILGTLNLLEATKKLKDLSAVLIVTTDKVYKNHGQFRGYVETDELGGLDPYSASKAATDLAAQAWIKSYATTPVAIARAGNVIGGGDFSRDRIVPDIVRAINFDQKLVLRNPESIRPWQHVLDCLNGYLCLLDMQDKQGFSGEWNFGPQHSEIRTVRKLVDEYCKHVDKKLEVEVIPSVVLESKVLVLDSQKSQSTLGWKNKLNFEEAVMWTASWFNDAKNKFRTNTQIAKFLSL